MCTRGGWTLHAPYIRDQILELVNESLLVAVLEADPSRAKLNMVAENTSIVCLVFSAILLSFARLGSASNTATSKLSLTSSKI